MAAAKPILCDLQEEKLASLCAWRRGSPVRSKQDLDAKLKLKPMSKYWREALKSKWWSTGYTGDPKKPVTAMDAAHAAQHARKITMMLALRDQLLALGGREVCLPVGDPDRENVVTRGQLWLSEGRKLMPGRRNRCHENTGLLWCKNADKVAIATGYAMSEEGCWYQHSWGVQPRARGGAIIVETTVPFQAYFGFVHTLQESIDFCDNNIFDSPYTMPRGAENEKTRPSKRGSSAKP